MSLARSFGRPAELALIPLLASCATTAHESTPPPPANPRVTAVPPPPAAPVSPAPPAPVVAPGSPGSPDAPRPGAVWPPPGGWEPPPCELETSTSISRSGAVYTVTARLKNLTQKQLEFGVPDRCPQGPMIFHGLGEGYDYYGACTKGACAGGRPAIRYSLSPGQSLEIGAIQLWPGGGGCNPALEPGRYVISFGLPVPHRLCGGPAAELTHAAPAKPKPAKHSPTAASKCPPPLTCGLACPGGAYAHDEHGCSQCACDKARTAIEDSPPSR